MLISSACMSLSQNTTMDTPRIWILALLGIVGEKVVQVESWFTLAEENRTLKNINAELTLQNAQLQEAYFENKRLRDLLAFEQDLPYSFVPVRVIGMSNRNFVSSVIINAGSNQGLQKDMPLFSAQGLVGKLYSVGKNQSLGQLLIDQNFRVSARIQRSRITGILKWNNDRLSLEHVPKRSDVVKGDAVMTSGLTNMFPKGLAIGTVYEVSEKIDGLFMHILVNPSVNFAKIEELFVVDPNFGIRDIK